MSLCTICLLPRRTRDRIDAALYAGVGYRKISVRYSTKTRKFSHVAVCRHRKHLIPQDARRQPPPPDPKVAGTLMDRIEGMITEFRAIADATRKDQPPWAIAAMKEIMRGLEMIGKMTGEIPAGGIGVNFNFANVNLNEEQMTTFLDGIRKRPQLEGMFCRLVRERYPFLGPPIVHVNFVHAEEGRAVQSPPPESSPAKAEPPFPGGNAALYPIHGEDTYGPSPTGDTALIPIGGPLPS